MSCKGIVLVEYVEILDPLQKEHSPLAPETCTLERLVSFLGFDIT